MITGPNEVILSPEEWAMHEEVIEAARRVDAARVIEGERFLDVIDQEGWIAEVRHGGGLIAGASEFTLP